MDVDLLQRLLAWYRTAGRDLPWRSDPTPYKVLLSELMLQQTRVETALPYFERFLARWPTLDRLAAASEDELVSAWAGLGYYRRARFLHRCAVAAVERGGLPSDAASLRRLPGIGPYTAGAVASIAFGERVPVVDGNVERVLSRLHALEADPRSTSGKRALWTLATALHEALPDGEHPGDLNQALMELGATVCTPRAPRCAPCPVRAACRGRERPEDFPRKKPRRAPVPILGAAGLLWLDGRPLLARRSPGGLLGGLWEPPRVDIPEASHARDALSGLFADLGLVVEVGAAVARVSHTFTHRQLTASVHPVALVGGEPARGGVYDAVAAVDPATVGLSTLARKVLEQGGDRPQCLPLAADAE